MVSRQVTSFGGQYKAYLKVLWNLQRRKWTQNIVLLICPVLVCLGLFFSTKDVDSVEFSNENFRCGCKCLECCNTVNNGTQTQYVCYNSTDENPCSPYDHCLRRDPYECGFLYSTADQAQFCEIRQPPLWPTLLQIPSQIRQESDPVLYIGYTGENETFVGSIASKLLKDSGTIAKNVARSYAKSVISVNSMDLQEYGDPSASYSTNRTTEFVETIGAMTRGLFEFGLILATTSNTGSNWLIEPAFSSGAHFQGNTQSKLYILQTSCDRMDADEKHTLITLGQAISNVTGVLVQCLTTQPLPLPSAEDIDHALYCSSPAAKCTVPSKSETFLPFDWQNSGSGNFNLTIWVNNTHRWVSMDIPDVQRWSKPLNLATNAYMQALYGPEVSLSMAGIKDMPRSGDPLSLDFSALFGPLFLMWILQILLPIITSSVLLERTTGVRLMSIIQGLRADVYYFGQYTWYSIIYVAYMFVLLGLGFALGLKIFMLNSIFVQLVFYGVVGLAMQSFSRLYSSLFVDRKAATLSSVLYIAITGFIANVFMVQFIEQEIKVAVYLLQLIPSFAIFSGLYELSQYAFLAEQTGGTGMQLRTMENDPQMLYTIIFLAVEFVVFAALSLYIEYMHGSVDGIRKSPLLWIKHLRSKTPKIMQRQLDGDNGQKDKEDIKLSPSEPDELEYYFGFFSSNLMLTPKGDLSAGRKDSLELYFGRNLQMENAEPEKEIKDLGPLFIGRDSVMEQRSKVSLIKDIWTNESFDSTEDYSLVISEASKRYQSLQGPVVEELSLALRSKEAFGLIGTDGSGKSTVLAMIHGFVPASSGEILIHQREDSSCVSPQEANIGFCSQFDLLWEDMTVIEHLFFYARIKIRSSYKVEESVCKAISSLDLQDVCYSLVRNCKSGCKRRLSVAIALLGNPSIVCIDEPSVGLDPYSRKMIWETLRESKKSKTVVISTSDVLEAESLCDRIAILKEGKLKCLGSPKDLISLYGGYLWLTLVNRSSSREHSDKTIQVIQQNFPESILLHVLGSRLQFGLPTNRNEIESVFRKIEKAKLDKVIDIIDWSICSPSLEDVFLNISEH